MLNSRWILEFEFFQIMSGIFIFPNLILSMAYVDSCWPILFAFFQILSGICIFTNMVLSVEYDNSRWPLELASTQILILSMDYGDILWPRF